MSLIKISERFVLNKLKKISHGNLKLINYDGKVFHFGDLESKLSSDIKINKPNLIIPHPRLHIRKFVIKPICDINPVWRHPILKIKAINLLKVLANQKIFNIWYRKFRS